MNNVGNYTTAGFLDTQQAVDGVVWHDGIIASGVAQSSTLSPILFALFSANISSHFKVLTTFYADDMHLFRSPASRTPHCTPEVVREIEIYDQCIKFKFIFFSKSMRTSPELRLKNKKITWKMFVKYLEVVLDVLV